jgi:hypothetical protein
MYVCIIVCVYVLYQAHLGSLPHTIMVLKKGRRCSVCMCVRITVCVCIYICDACICAYVCVLVLEKERRCGMCVYFILFEFHEFVLQQ